MKYIIIILLVLSPSIYLSVKGALEDTSKPEELPKWELYLEDNKVYFQCYKELTEKGISLKEKVEQCENS